MWFIEAKYIVPIFVSVLPVFYAAYLVSKLIHKIDYIETMIKPQISCKNITVSDIIAIESEVVLLIIKLLNITT